MSVNYAQFLRVLCQCDFEFALYFKMCGLEKGRRLD